MVMQWRVVGPGGLNRYPFTDWTRARAFAVKACDTIGETFTVEYNPTGDWSNRDEWEPVYSAYPVGNHTVP